MKYFSWNKEKNEVLKKQRNIGFEQIVDIIISVGFLADEKHKNKTKYPNQKIYIVEIENYAYLVPYVEDDEKIFLKTIIPSHKATKKYLNKK